MGVVVELVPEFSEALVPVSPLIVQRSPRSCCHRGVPAQVETNASQQRPAASQPASHARADPRGRAPADVADAQRPRLEHQRAAADGAEARSAIHVEAASRPRAAAAREPLDARVTVSRSGLAAGPGPGRAAGGDDGRHERWVRHRGAVRLAAGADARAHARANPPRAQEAAPASG